MEILNSVGEFSKVGIIGLSFFCIIYVVWLNSKKSDKQIEAYNSNMKSLVLEISQLNASTVELVAKNDLHREDISEIVKRIEKQVVAVHERINSIAEKQTGIDLTVRDIKTITDKCTK